MKTGNHRSQFVIKFSLVFWNLNFLQMVPKCFFFFFTFDLESVRNFRQSHGENIAIVIFVACILICPNIIANYKFASQYWKNKLFLAYKKQKINKLAVPLRRFIMRLYTLHVRPHLLIALYRTARITYSITNSNFSKNYLIRYKIDDMTLTFNELKLD